MSSTTPRISVTLAATALVMSATSVASATGNASPEATQNTALKALIAEQGPAPDGFTSWQQLWKVQEPLFDQAVKLREEARYAGSGYAGVSIDLKARTVDLYWKGGVPASFQSRLRSARATAAVHVHKAKFTEAESNVAAKKASAGGIRLADGSQVPKSVINSVSVNQDGSGISLNVAGESDSVLGSSAQTLAVSTEGGGSTAATFDGVQVKVVKDSTAKPAQYNASRLTEPHIAGGYTYFPANALACTSGFGVVTSTGAARMLTAQHCGGQGKTVQNNTGAAIGTVTASNSQSDSAIFSISSGAAPTDDMHLGKWYGDSSDNNIYTTVSSFADPVVGSLVCQSGAYSGNTCDIKITKSGVYWLSSGPGFLGVSNNGSGGVPGAGQGDSGGPVYLLTSTGKIEAVGTLSSGDGVITACRGSQSPGRVCSSGFYFSGAATIAKVLGLKDYL